MTSGIVGGGMERDSIERDTGRAKGHELQISREIGRKLA